jgi:hypothetical protein
MESIVVIAVFAGLAYWAYREGKREGSRKGFSVGRNRRKK